MSHLELAKKTTKNKRKALVVGINKYTKLSGADLSGCVNDAKDFVNTLLILGFPPTRIKVLTDEKATKANIENGLKWLVKGAKPGDVLIYYHSGHGSQKIDVNDDEEDRYDEMLIPSDFVWDDPETHLTDDDLHRYLTRQTPEGVRAEVVLDTCFSGTGTRSLFRTTKPLIANNQVYDPSRPLPLRTAKFLPLPVEQRILLSSKITFEDKEKMQHFGTKLVEKDQNNILHSACAYNQVAWEMANESGEVRGVFTYDYCQILRRCNGNKTRREIYQILLNSLMNAGAEQTPQLEVPKSQPQMYDQYPFRRSIEDDPTEIPTQ